MRNTLTPYSIETGEENISFFTPFFIFIKREKIKDNELLKSKEKSVNPFDYHVSNCGIHSFKNLRVYESHSNYD